MGKKTTRITLLVDNEAPPIAHPAPPVAGPAGLAAEHGLSVWIEHAGKRILLDTGQGPSLESNAKLLGIDLSQTDILALSHGHYDHTGGVERLLRLAPQARVYCHPSIAKDRYSIRPDRAPHAIGIPEGPLEAMRCLPDGAIHWVSGPTRLTDLATLTGPVPRLTDYEDTGGPFYQDDAGWRPDPLEDDQAFWIETDEGLVICLGCAHSGVVNTLGYIQSLTPDTPIRAVIGGLHLAEASQDRLERTIDAIRELDIPEIVPCHCTGVTAIKAFRSTLGERVLPGGPGTTLEF